MFKIFVYYLIVINLVTFFTWGWDKRAAGRGGRRVPEKRLLWMAFLLGAPGAWAGVRVFRHKTIKKIFRLRLIAVTVVQVLIVGYALFARLAR